MKSPEQKSFTVKAVYVEHVDNWFLKLDLYYLNEYVFKKQLSTCLRQTDFIVLIRLSARSEATDERGVRVLNRTKVTIRPAKLLFH